VFVCARACVSWCAGIADEQLCGYSRYRTKLKVGGPEAVLDDMAKDMARIWCAVLGRCVSVRGTECAAKAGSDRDDSVTSVT
jgi:hypothetical protein